MSRWSIIFIIALLWVLLMLADTQGDALWGIAGGAILIVYVIRELRVTSNR